MSDPHYDKVSLLLPMFGANNGTTFTDYSPGPKTISRFGDTKTVTAQSKYYGSSGYFDGSGDYLSIPDSDAYAFGTGDFTIEFWYRFAVAPSAAQVLLNQRADGSNALQVSFGTNVIGLDTYAGGTRGPNFSFSATHDTTTWRHLAIVRNGTAFACYVDGSSIGTMTSSASMPDINANLDVGRWSGNGLFFNGYIQDLRITKGVACYTENFTPPTKFIGTISGTITDDAGDPAVRSIVAFPRVYPQRVATTTSAADGTYSLTNLPVTEYSRIVLDDHDAPTYNDLIKRVIPG
jgi:hypothetical protein